MQLSGHKVLVTGGSAGIGLALARALAAKGNQVVICGRNRDRLEAAREASGARAAIVADLGDPGAAAALASKAARSLDGLTVLVNNAGVQYNDRFAALDPGEIAAHAASEIQINLTSLVALTAACLPYLRQSPGGAIVNVSSVLAIQPKASAPVYCATKAAVRSFTRALRYQLEDDLPGLQVFEVQPPLVDTGMTEGRGKGKISPAQVATETLDGMARDRAEIRVGKARLVGAINRVMPALAARILRNG